MQHSRIQDKEDFKMETLGTVLHGIFIVSMLMMTSLILNGGKWGFASKIGAAGLFLFLLSGVGLVAGSEAGWFHFQASAPF